MGLVIFFLLLLEGYAIFVGRLGFIIVENKLIIFSKLFLRLKDFFEIAINVRTDCGIFIELNTV